MIKRIAFYDFDGTLMDTPLPETGKPHWKEVTGEEYPHVGWWGRAESLDLNVFDIKAFPSIADRLRNDVARSDTYTVILTSRLKKLQPYLEKILQHNNLTVDEWSPKNDGREKDDRIKEFLKRFPEVEEIDLYDDREKEFKVFANLKNEIGHEVRINVYKADNGHLSTILENVIWDEMTNMVIGQGADLIGKKFLHQNKDKRNQYSILTPMDADNSELKPEIKRWERVDSIIKANNTHIDPVSGREDGDPDANDGELTNESVNKQVIHSFVKELWNDDSFKLKTEK